MGNFCIIKNHTDCEKFANEKIEDTYYCSNCK